MSFLRVGTNVYMVGYSRLQFPGLLARVSEISNTTLVSYPEFTHLATGLSVRPEVSLLSLSFCFLKKLYI